MAEIHIREQVEPTTPQSGKIKLFVDSADSRVKQKDSTGLVKDLTDSAAPADNCRIGFADYDDLVTASTPIAITGGGGDINLPNDAAGAQTIKTYLPTGVTDVWDATGGVFDWSELSVGDMVDIRMSLAVTTTSINTEVNVALHLGTGAGSYSIPFISNANFKSTGTYQLNRFNSIYIGDSNTLDNGGVFKANADNNCAIEVIGWYCKVLIRGA